MACLPDLGGGARSGSACFLREVELQLRVMEFLGLRGGDASAVWLLGIVRFWSDDLGWLKSKAGTGLPPWDSRPLWRLGRRGRTGSPRWGP